MLLRSLITVTLVLSFAVSPTLAEEKKEVPWSQVPAGLDAAHVAEQSVGCQDCHAKTDAPSMHTNPAVQIGCADCDCLSLVAWWSNV